MSSDGRVISDIVKRRSFRAPFVAASHGRRALPAFRVIARSRAALVGSVPDRRESSVRSCKLVFLISVPSLRASETRNGFARRVRVGIDNESDQVNEGHLVDALALRGDEGRATLRKAARSCEGALIRGYPNGETHLR